MMITYEQLSKQISDVQLSQGDLQELKVKWDAALLKLHDFIEMFLERFGNRVIGDKDNSPEWTLYSKKYDEYSAYSRAIRALDYFIAKEKLKNG